MRVLLFTVLLFSSLLSDEIQRIESIVSDITKLRADYEACKSSLSLKSTNEIVVGNEDKNIKYEDKIKELERLLKDEKAKSILIKEELKLDYSNKESKFDKKIKKLEKLLKSKENKILSLEKKYKKESQNKVIKKNNLNNTVFLTQRECADDNKFPKLIMKPNLVKYEIVSTDPQSFKLRETTFIYNRPQGEVVTSWEEKTSFTSNKKSRDWIKITGYFIDKQWVKSQKSLWIEEKFIVKK